MGRTSREWHVGVYWGLLGQDRGLLGPCWRPFGGHLEGLLGPLGGFFDVLGRSWRPVGRRLKKLLEPLWAVMGPYWGA
eukprot:5551856-Pyramimonas_sp.AAC.1